jgi:hypothetical protein
MSTRAKTDSMIISRTMGILSNIIALLKGIFVKSRSDPPMASLRSLKKSLRKFLLNPDLIFENDI